MFRSMSCSVFFGFVLGVSFHTTSHADDSSSSSVDSSSSSAAYSSSDAGSSSSAQSSSENSSSSLAGGNPPDYFDPEDPTDPIGDPLITGSWNMNSGWSAVQGTTGGAPAPAPCSYHYKVG